MKSNHRNIESEYDGEAYEDPNNRYEMYMMRDKKNADRRRPIRNWKKVWSDHTEDYDEVDDFYATKRR